MHLGRIGYLRITSQASLPRPCALAPIACRESPRLASYYAKLGPCPPLRPFSVRKAGHALTCAVGQHRVTRLSFRSWNRIVQRSLCDYLTRKDGRGWPSLGEKTS